jgi:hypothetical protein
MKKFGILAAVAGFGMLAPASQAHHSFAMFDRSQTIKVSGTVREFQWTNPHAYIQLMAKDAQGNDVEWSLEMGAPMYLYARGWRPRTLRPGMEVSIDLYPLRSGEPGGVVVNVNDANGNAIGTNE